MTARMSTHRYMRVAPAVLLAISLATPSFAQTKIVAPNNKYAPADDVKLGQEAAAQVRKEMVTQL